MPNYDKIFQAAYTNDKAQLETLMSGAGVDPNHTYKWKGEGIISALATGGLYAKKIVGGAGATAFGGVGGSVAVGTEISAATSLAAGATAAAGPAVFGLVIIGIGLGIYFGGDKDITKAAYDKTGWTALHFAVLGGAEDAVRVLLKYGVDPRKKDEAGRTCAAIAVIQRNVAMADLLVEQIEALKIIAESTAIEALKKAAEAARREGAALAAICEILGGIMPQSAASAGVGAQGGATSFFQTASAGAGAGAGASAPAANA